MRINTHDRTPIVKMKKLAKVLLILSILLIYCPFLLAAFCLFYYGKSIGAGLSLIILPVFLLVLTIAFFKDMQNCYVEIQDSRIRIVNYYFLQPKESFLDIDVIDSYKIYMAGSFKVKGRRINYSGSRYFVYYDQDGKYLFKILKTPEAEIFNQKLFK